MRFRSYDAWMLCALLVTGCAQPDGPMPVIQGEVSDRLEDITRDLTRAARGEGQAGVDLAGHLTAFTEPAADEEARRLGERVAAALAGRPLQEGPARTLANQLWIAVAARELSERQVQTLRNDVEALLTSTGANERSAQAAATQVVDVQRVVTLRSRKWYERF